MRPENPMSGRSLAMLVSAGILLLAVFPGWPLPLSQDRPTGAAQVPPAPPAPASDSGILSSRTPVVGGPSPDLVFFYSGEVMGWIEPCG